MRLLLQKHHLNGGKRQICRRQEGQKEVKYLCITIAQLLLFFLNFFYRQMKQLLVGLFLNYV